MGTAKPSLARKLGVAAVVLTGVTTLEGIGRFPYRPTHVARSIADIEP